MFSFAILFTALPLLYFTYGLLGRKLTISEIDRKAVPITGCGILTLCLLKVCRPILLHELQPFGVDVIEIVPGCFKTGFSTPQTLRKSVDTLWHRASQEMHDEYGHDYNEKAIAYGENLQLLLLTKDITWVIDAYYEAIVARRPKLLYRIGWDTLFKFYPYSYLPLRLQLYVMKFLMYLSGAPLPAITTKNLHPGNSKSKVS
ncbi:unnamed protein product [Acanthocheilonema viteae]|uniref:Uncharacterized protein n=1 Tax=Acanthocheilonema viteae TaxID=6277 RepID=A0A498SYX0_ACAVI|nr:unnamed protein product [Acanthocheilonema viteae]